MTILVIALALAMPALLLAFERGRVLPAFLTMTSLSQIMVGHALLDEETGASIWPLFFLGILTFSVGYLLHSGRYPSDLRPLTKPNKVDALRLQIMFVIVGSLALYHFVIGGVPLLSDQVEVQRFGFASSGLFGIPGRMYLFGLLFVVILTSLYRRRWKLEPSRGVFLAAWILYGGTQLLSGFKGSLLYVVLTVLLVRALSGHPITVRRAFSPRYVIVVLAVFGYAILVTLRYESVGVSTPVGATPYLLKRATVFAAEPGHLAISTLAELNGSSYMVDDARYFLERYFGVNAGRAVFPLDMVVSSHLTGTPLNTGQFISPVTVGSFASLVVDVGEAWAVGLMALVGFIYAASLRRAMRARTPFAAAAWGFIVHMIHVYVLNGGLAYVAINTMVMLSLLWLIDRFSHMLSLVLRGPAQSGVIVSPASPPRTLGGHSSSFSSRLRRS